MNPLENQSLENLQQVTAVTAFTHMNLKSMEKKTLCSGRTVTPFRTFRKSWSQLLPVKPCQSTTVLWDTVPLSQWGYLPCCQLNRIQDGELGSSLTELCRQGYVQAGCWDVALGLCELSPPKRRHCSRPGPNCQWAPLRLTPIFRLPREEMGWWLLPLQQKPFYCVKTSEL